MKKYLTLFLNLVKYLTCGQLLLYVQFIHSGKGDMADLDYYRGITILSCYGQLFTTVLNNRFKNCYLENMNILCKEQAGFRKTYGTYDHIFIFQCIV